MQHAGKWIAIAGAARLCGLLCAIFPALARVALSAFSIPAMARLHRLTAPIAFPVAELIAQALISTLLAGLLQAIHLSMTSRSPLPLRRWLSALLIAVLLPSGALILLWAPAWALPVRAVSAPDDRLLALLCEDLIDALNAAPLSFPTAAESLRRAPGVAGLNDCVVKAVRYPEWMTLTNAWGLFVPITGEALVDAAEPAPLVPFTAVHELMHLTGIADEGAANIAAWNHCIEAGGAFADSARLWALRYAMGLLRLLDEPDWLRVSAKMKDGLTRVFRECGAEADSDRPHRVPLTRGDYTALACHLAGLMHR